MTVLVELVADVVEKILDVVPEVLCGGVVMMIGTLVVLVDVERKAVVVETLLLSCEVVTGMLEMEIEDRVEMIVKGLDGRTWEVVEDSSWATARVTSTVVKRPANFMFSIDN